MSSKQSPCAHCGQPVHVDMKVAHERACRQERTRAPPTAAAQHRPVQASRQAPNRLGAPPTFQIPDPPADDRSKSSKSVPANRRAAPVAPPVHGTTSQPTTSTPPAMVQINIPVPQPVPQAVGHGGAAPMQPVGAGYSQPPVRPAQYPEGSYKIEFHPHANRAPVFEHAQDFQHAPVVDVRDLNQEPWAPAFNSRIDFELAEFSLKAGLNEPQVVTLLELIRRILDEPTEFTLEKASDVLHAWEGAKFKQPAFECSLLEVDISEGDRRTYEFHHRDIWDVGVSLVQDPLLSKHMVWHAVKQFRRENKEWVRFVDEPYTADLLYEYQSKLPTGAVPLPFVLYADKTRLSTFGTQEGYPIVVRLANLPAAIRNSSGHGSGQVVGMLPAIKDPNAKKGETKLIKHKRVVWHAGFSKVMKKAIEHARLGKRVRCGDGTWRLLIPLILILVADYEEQCTMTLIRGLKGLFPCPVCLVPHDKLSELGLKYELRTSSQAIAILNDKTLNKGQLEEALKEKSLRPIPNSLWPLCDPHRSTSFDKLHAYETGLFGTHLFGEFLKIVKAVRGNQAIKAVNTQYNAIPRWSGLYHTDNIISRDFSDGSKYDDISRVIVPATYNVVVAAATSGLALMRAIRIFGMMNVVVSFEVQTKERLELFDSLLILFAKAIEDYMDVESDKNWEFPKNHSHAHVVMDIWLKGVIKNFTSKPSEKMHRLLKEIYRDRTNFKKVEGQITAIAHQFVVALYIRFQMETYDELTKAIEPEEKHHLHQYHHVYLGSPDASLSLGRLVQRRGAEPALKGLTKKLAVHITATMQSTAKKGQVISLAELPADLKITPFKYLKIQYVSMETWRVAHDPLRCNPSFYHEPRYDFVMYRGAMPDEYHFGELQFVFACDYDNKTFPVAVVRPYDPVYLPRSKIDAALGIFRLRARPYGKLGGGPEDSDSDEADPNSGAGDPYVLVHLGSLVRGVVAISDPGLASEYSHEDPPFVSMAHETELDIFWNEYYRPEFEQPQPDDRLIADLVDGDMFLRLRKYFPFLTT